jgi:hypothetical protein
MRSLVLLSICGILLAGCEQLGIEDPAKAAAAKEAEGRAIGGACRHSGRALEECYALNKRASKAAIFTGWRDMDAYMRENNIEVVPPPGKAIAPPPAKPAAEPAPAPQEAAPTQGSATQPLPAAGGRMV